MDEPVKKANDMQVGGTHYKTKYEHWDFVLDTGMGYFDGQATKYVTRWRNKEGVKDLKKALHFVNKMLENLPKSWPYRDILPEDFSEMFARYKAANDLHELEEKIIIYLAFRPDAGQGLYEVRDLILVLIDEADDTPHTDSNKHAFQKEDEA